MSETLDAPAILIENGRVVDPCQGIDRVARVLVQGEVIAAIDPSDGDLPPNCEVVDAAGCIVAPGLVDLEVEVGEPGQEEDETIESGCRAAIAGGFTSIACAPSTEPPIDTAAAVEFVRQKAARANQARVHVVGCVSKGRQGKELAEIGTLIEAGAVALSDYPAPIHNTALLRRALEYCLMFDRPIIDRPEVPSLVQGGVMHEGLTQLILALAPMPAEAEDVATSRDLRLLETTKGRLHLSSVSTAGSMDLLRRSKARGTKVSAGIRVANLCLNDEMLRSFDSSLKVNPPLRSQEHIDACLAAVMDGTIDVISSGHQPHSLEKKMQELDAAPFGMSSLDTTLSMVNQLIRAGSLSWSRAIECLSTNPAKIMGLEVGHLSVGAPADIVVFDMEKTWKVTREAMASLSSNSPLLHREVVGKVRNVWVGGTQKL